MAPLAQGWLAPLASLAPLGWWLAVAPLAQVASLASPLVISLFWRGE